MTMESAPAEVRDAVAHVIGELDDASAVDRFANGDPSNDAPIDGVELPGQYQGGDFARDTASGWNSFLKGNEIQYVALPTEKGEEVLASKDPVRLKPEYAEKYQLYAGLEAGFVFEVFNFSFPEVGYHPDPAQERPRRAVAGRPGRKAPAAPCGTGSRTRRDDASPERAGIPR